MRKRRKIKWVVALVVSFVLMMLAPAISNHPVQAEQSSTEENQTDKPWVTSLPFVTISEYNESAGTKGKDYYRTEVTFDEEEHSVEFITAGYGGDGQPHVENNGIMFNLDPINGEGVDLSKYEYVEVDMEGTGGEAFVKLMKNSDSYWSQIDGGIFIEPVQGERQKMYLHEIQIAVEKCFQNVQERLPAMPQMISQPDDSIVQQSEEVEEGIDEFLESFSL